MIERSRLPLSEAPSLPTARSEGTIHGANTCSADAFLAPTKHCTSIRISCSPADRLGRPVHQRPPQPLDGPEAVSAQPPLAEDKLRRVERHAERAGRRRPDPAELAQPIAEEDEAQDERLQDVVRERHAPERREREQKA